MHNKILLILSLTTLLTLTSSSTSPHHLHSNDLKILWEVWKEQNHKSYEKAEEAARFAIFVENYKRVTNYNILDNGVTLTLNKFADLTLDEFNAYHSGTYLANFDIFDLNTTNIVDFSGFDLPDTVDWREQGATTPVQSQGTCGSCWAWSVIGALEGLNYITTGKLVPFSVQQLLDCDESNHGCEGGWYNRAFNYTASSGVLREEDYPYTESESNCQYDENKAVKVNSGYSYVQPKNASALKASLAVQPVALSVQAYQIIMQFYRSGVIKGDCEGDADHAVLAVGYVNMDGEEAFVVKNSYGDDWGDNGYVYISTDDTINSGHGACGVLFRPIVPVV